MVPRTSKNESIYNGSGYVDWLSKTRMFVLRQVVLYILQVP